MLELRLTITPISDTDNLNLEANIKNMIQNDVPVADIIKYIANRARRQTTKLEVIA